jgi:glutamine synthetase
LVAAGILAGGLYGLRKQLTLGPPLLAESDASTFGTDLSSSLEEAVDVFENSPLAREFLGPEFVASFVATRRGELAAFTQWWRGTVTDWERKRYMEQI